MRVCDGCYLLITGGQHGPPVDQGQGVPDQGQAGPGLEQPEPGPVASQATQIRPAQPTYTAKGKTRKIRYCCLRYSVNNINSGGDENDRVTAVIDKSQGAGQPEEQEEVEEEAKAGEESEGKDLVRHNTEEDTTEEVTEVGSCNQEVASDSVSQAGAGRELEVN